MTANPNLRVIARCPGDLGEGFVADRPFFSAACCRKLQAAAIVLLLLCCPGFQLTHAQDVQWLRAKPLRDRLASPISVEWSAVQFRPALERLSRAQRVAVLIDRRIDPNHRCDLDIDEQALSDVFTRLASIAGCGYSQLGPVAYFGPEPAAHQLRTLAALTAQHVNELPPTSRRIWRRTRAWHWDDLASPRQLIQGLATEHGIKLTGMELIPHDLWSAADVPPLSLAERFLLVTVQFDLTLEIDRAGDSARLIRIPAEVALQRRYSGRGNPERIARHYQKLAPTARIEIDGRDILVRGRLEDHERIVGGPASKKDRPPLGTQVFRLKVENVPVARLLDHVSQRMGYAIKIDHVALSEAGLTLDKRVSVDVTDATIDALMKAILEPAGLTHRRQAKTLEVVPLTRMIHERSAAEP